MPTFAAVDIGSNSVRLKIARLQAGRLRALHEDREVTRLGEGVFGSGFLTPDSMAETVKVLRRFHRATQQIVTDTRARGCDQRSARCAQFAGLPGVGTVGDGLASGDHLRRGRSATDSPGTGLEPAGRPLSDADDGSGRRQLRTDGYARRTHSRRGQPASRRGSSDQ